MTGQFQRVRAGSGKEKEDQKEGGEWEPRLGHSYDGSWGGG
jgi:hypothetical protein